MHANKKKEISTAYRETFLTFHLHQPTQCPHVMEEFLIPGRKKSATYGDPVQPSPSEHQLSHCYMGDTPICKCDGSVFEELSTEKLVV